MPRLIFVPGFGGSTLYLNQRDSSANVISRRQLWGGIGQVVNASSLEALAIPKPAEYAGNIEVGEVAFQLMSYREFLVWLYANYANAKGWELVKWPYDFRLHARDLGARLAKDLATWPPIQGGNIVLAHSYGALVAWCAWATLVDNGQTPLLSRLTTFGAILYGTHTAAAPWAERDTGIDMMSIIGVIRSGEIATLSNAARGFARLAQIRLLLETYCSWPAAYCMLPDFFLKDDPGDTNRPALLYDAAPWQYALAQPQQSLMDDARIRLWGWLKDPKYTPSAGVANHIVATGQPTPNRVYPRVEMSSVLLANTIERASRIENRQARQSLLPRWEIDPEGDARATQAQQRFPGCHVEFVVGEHGELQNNPGVLATIPTLLIQEETIPQPPDPPPIVPPSDQWMVDGSWLTTVGAPRPPGATVGQTRPVVVHDP